MVIQYITFLVELRAHEFSAIIRARQNCKQTKSNIH